MQARQKDAKPAVEDKLLRTKAAKAKLALGNSKLLARLKEAAHTLDSMTKPHKGPCAVVKSTPKQSIFCRKQAPMPPPPLSTYVHSASFSVEDILPLLLQKKRQSSASASDTGSSNMLFADVSLVRDAVASHRAQVLADLGVKATETAWYFVTPREVRSSLCLSQSSTLGSTACVMSSVLNWISCKYEAACLVFLEDNLRAAQSLSTSGWHTILDQRSEIDCSLSTDPKLPGGTKYCSAVSNSEQRGAKVLEEPLHVPTPQLQLLGRYGLMCGENQRVPILEAVPYLLRHLLLRYHKQLRIAVWQRICLQFMHEMHRAAVKLHPSSAGYGIAQHEHGAWSDGEWPDECPWAHVQEVAGEMMKLCLVTIHEAYCQSFNEGGLLSDSSEFSESLLSLGQVVERLQEESCCMAIVSSVLLTDAPATYRMLVANDQDLLIRSPMVRSCIRWLCLYCVSLTSVSQYHHRYRIHVFAVPCSESFPKQHPPKINRWEGKVRQRSLQR